MGNSTIIEINHDRWDEISKNKELFANQILEQCQIGVDGRQEIEGGQIIAFFPRYDDNKTYRAWCRWKCKWSKGL